MVRSHWTYSSALVESLLVLSRESIVIEQAIVIGLARPVSPIATVRHVNAIGQVSAVEMREIREGI